METKELEDYQKQLLKNKRERELKKIRENSYQCYKELLNLGKTETEAFQMVIGSLIKEN